MQLSIGDVDAALSTCESNDTSAKRANAIAVLSNSGVSSIIDCITDQTKKEHYRQRIAAILKHHVNPDCCIDA